MKALKSSLNIHINKSYVEGVYSDNAHNRKLGRVGMSYSSGINLEGFETEKDNGDTFVTNPKIVLKRAKQLLSEKAFSLIKKIMENDSFKEGDIYEYQGIIYINSNLEVNPEDGKEIMNLGLRVEDKVPKEENSYYKFVRDTWSPEQLEKKWLSTFEQQESWGMAKYYSLLSRLQMENEIRDNILEGEKRDLWWKKYNSGEVDLNSDYSDISDTEVERYIRVHGRKVTKDQLAYNSRHKSLIDALKNYGIDFYVDRNKIDKFKDEFKSYIINCPRNEFYQVVKNSCTNEDSSFMEDMIRLRFGFKYNKMIVGQGWNEIKDDKGKINIAKRDEVIELCKQIEYAVDDVLGTDKDLFINNPNIDFIRFDKNTQWGGASYSKSDKTITITSEYFQSLKQSRNRDKRASTLSREKFLVEGFIHEIGHSLDVTEDIYDSPAYKDFARHLGYDKNKQYTIYTNAIKGQDKNFIEGQDYYLGIERDKKQELIDKFKGPYEEYFGKLKQFTNEDIADIFISKYSSKSACEGFAEYFSFYMGNKKVIDKAISEYKKNPKEFLAKAKIKNWYKHSVYEGKWEGIFDAIPERFKNSEGTKALRRYYELVAEHNIQMLEDIQKIVKLSKENMTN